MLKNHFQFHFNKTQVNQRFQIYFNIEWYRIFSLMWDLLTHLWHINKISYYHKHLYSVTVYPSQLTWLLTHINGISEIINVTQFRSAYYSEQVQQILLCVVIKSLKHHLLLCICNDKIHLLTYLQKPELTSLLYILFTILYMVTEVSTVLIYLISNSWQRLSIKISKNF